MDYLNYRPLLKWDEYTSYLYGYILGDGTMEKKSIRINSTDIENMSRLADLAGDVTRRVVQPMKDGKPYGNQSMIIRFNSLEYFNFFQDLGIIQNKSELGCELKEIPHNGHFLRGLFDSDGCVTVYRDGLTYCLQSRIEGHKSYLCQLLDEFKEFQGISVYSSEVRNGLSKIDFNGYHLSKKFYEFIYQDASIFIERKRKTFEDYFSWKKSPKEVKNSIDWNERMRVRKENKEIVQRLLDSDLDFQKLREVKLNKGFMGLADYLNIRISAAKGLWKKINEFKD